MRRPLTLPLDRTAAVFIDLQEEHRRDPGFLAEGYVAVIANAAALQKAARVAGVPVYHYAYAVDPDAGMRPFNPVKPDGRPMFSDRDDPNTAICPEVAPVADEPVIVKNQASAFGTGLGRELQEQGIEWLVVAGVWTEACVYETVKDAQALGFRVLLVKDACASGTRAMHVIGILNLANRLYGGAVATTVATVALLAGTAADAWQIQGAVPIRYGFGDAETLYEAL